MTIADVTALAAKLTRLKKPALAATATWAATTLTSYAGAIDQLQGQVGEKQTMIDQLDATIAQLNTALAGLQFQVDQLKGTIATNQAALDQANATIAQQATAITADEAEITKATDQVAQLNTTVATLTQNVKDLQGQLAQATISPISLVLLDTHLHGFATTADASAFVQANPGAVVEQMNAVDFTWHKSA